MNIKGGAIIIGSLFWQDDLNSHHNKRRNWRDSFLDIQKKLLVKLPIRYGRYSSKNIYTMVFSPSCEQNKNLGTGYVIPFKETPIKDIDRIIFEAKMMSDAEGMGRKFLGGNREKWGAMAIIFNRRKLSQKTINKILTRWKQEYYKDGDCDILKEFKMGYEKRILTSKGELQIKWPTPLIPQDLEKINEIDFLIATVTKPKHRNTDEKRYPSIPEIAELVIDDNSREYFYNNFLNGIVTFQDIKIINFINSH